MCGSEKSGVCLSGVPFVCLNCKIPLRPAVCPDPSCLDTSVISIDLLLCLLDIHEQSTFCKHVVPLLYLLFLPGQQIEAKFTNSNLNVFIK